MTTVLDTAGPSPAPDASALPDAPPRARLAAAVPMTLVLLLAFALASVPARNSDVWRYLATGRALFDGSYTFGSDPFAYTTDGVAWINHAWLYDAMLFGLHRVAGVYLVIANAVLVVVLAGLLLLAARPAHRPWTASFAVALALVAMGPYLRLQPATLSYVFFAFVLWSLWHVEDAPDATRPLWADGPLLFVIALWANCDDWFLAGPITVALFWVGNAIASRRLHGRLFGITLASFAVCLLNPHHVHAFMLPAALGDAPLAPGRAASPLAALRDFSIAALPVPLVAYLLLVVLCLLTLLGNTARWSLPRVLIWVALCGLSLYRTSAIPFFAVAAGPLLARGWQGAAARALPQRLTLAGPVLGTIALGALIVAALPGWLQGTGELRGWFIRTDPSLQRLAEQLVEWRTSGQVDTAARGFQYSVDASHYLEWFCPAEKVFIDGRAHLFPAEVTAEFVQVRSALAGNPYRTPPQGALADVRPALQRWNVTHLVVADPREQSLVGVLMHLYALPEEWPLIALEGRAAVFAWQTPAGRPALTLPPLSLRRRAFAVGTTSTAPRHSAGRHAAPRPWWDCVVWPDAAGSLDRDEALSDIALFEAQRPSFPKRNFTSWQVELSTAIFGLVPPAAPAAPAHGVAASMPAALLAVTRRPIPPTGPTWFDQRALESMQRHGGRLDHGPPGSLLLAIRAARRALHANPNDAFAYLRLGHAYQLLLQETAEQTAPAEFGLLAEMRRVQAVAALTTALKLRPDLEIAHELLFTLYQSAGWIDLALDQLEQWLRLARQLGPRSGEAPKDFTIRIDALAAGAQQLGKLVRERMNLVDTQSVNFKTYGKAHLAESRGLIGHALQKLQDSPGYSEFGVEGAVLELHLLLYTGRIAEARSWLDPKQEPVMGTFHYGWMETLLAAAEGDYDTAGDALARITVTAVDVPELGLVQVRPRKAQALVLGQDLLIRTGYVLPPNGFGMLTLLAREESLLPAASQALGPLEGLLRRLDSLTNVLHQEADLHTLRGMLALEWGGIDSAARDFRAARAAWDSPAGSAALARHYQALLAEEQ